MTGGVFSLLFCSIGLLFPVWLNEKLTFLNQFILGYFQNFYLILGLLIVILALIILFLPFAKQRLGNEKPDYSYFSWIALLYSTGMGSGLLLRAVQEPLYYHQNPPIADKPIESLSLQYTFFHWGLTPWAMYSVFGLMVAYFVFIKKENNYMQAIRNLVKGKWIKAVIPYFIIIITISGVIASLGLGTGQFIGGINQYFHLNLGSETIIFTGLAIGVVGTLSARTGIIRVIKYLANFDVAVSLLLLFFVFVFMEFPHFFSNTFYAAKNYLLHFFEMSLAIGNYKPEAKFIQDWTVFYWAFWLSWVPFTGIFIARISRGRSIREFLVATIVVPTLASIVWFSVFGNSAFDIIKSNDPSLYSNVFTSLFVFLESYPLSSITVITAAILVLVAIINSVDSAIFVMSMLSDDGKEEPSKTHKLYWGITITLLAVGLLALGKTDLLTSVSNLLVIMAFPFALIYLWIIILFIPNFFRNEIKN